MSGLHHSDRLVLLEVRYLGVSKTMSYMSILLLLGSPNL